MQPGCPAPCEACKRQPRIQAGWDGFEPEYLSKNATYGFGDADQLLAFLFDELLPQIVQDYLPLASPKSLNQQLKQLDVALWGISDSAIAAWRAVSKRPGDFDAAILSSPFLLWNCGEPIEEIFNEGRQYVNRARRAGNGILPRIYIDYGTAEPGDFGKAADAFHEALKEVGFVEQKDLFLRRFVGDLHAGSAFWKHSPAALYTMFPF